MNILEFKYYRSGEDLEISIFGNTKILVGSKFAKNCKKSGFFGFDTFRQDLAKKLSETMNIGFCCQMFAKTSPGQKQYCLFVFV